MRMGTKNGLDRCEGCGHVEQVHAWIPGRTAGPCYRYEGHDRCECRGFGAGKGTR